MLWVVVGVGTALVAAGAAGLRASSLSRAARRARELAASVHRAGEGDLDRLRAVARRRHEEGPGPAAAEAWFALGCGLLNANRPEEATRAFQLACHSHPGLGSATLLAFACLKTRASDMPEFLRLLVETHAEIGRPRIPETAWESRVLDGLGAACRPPSARGGSLATALLRLPLRAVREQMAAALAERPAWAEPLVSRTNGPPSSDAGRPGAAVRAF